MSKTFWAVIAAIIIILGGIFYATSNHGKGSTGGSSATPTSNIQGSTSTGVKLVEYGDFECSACYRYYPAVEQVVAQYKDRIQFQFRNLPLTTVHPNAFAGARAGEAAALQGKFWDMYHLLYQNQDPTGASGWVASSDPLDNYFVGYATQLKLNVTQFKADYASSKVNSTVNADISEFKKTGLPESTPTFFLDGKQITPNATAADFQKAIDAEIKQKTGQ